MCTVLHGRRLFCYIHPFFPPLLLFFFSFSKSSNPVKSIKWYEKRIVLMWGSVAVLLWSIRILSFFIARSGPIVYIYTSNIEGQSYAYNTLSPLVSCMHFSFFYVPTIVCLFDRGWYDCVAAMITGPPKKHIRVSAGGLNDFLFWGGRAEIPASQRLCISRKWKKMKENNRFTRYIERRAIV